MAEERNPRRGRSPRGRGEPAPGSDAARDASAPESWVGRPSGGERPPERDQAEDAGGDAAGPEESSQEGIPDEDSGSGDGRQ